MKNSPSQNANQRPSQGSDPIVIALGGNAISPPETEGNIAQQFSQTRLTVQALADLVEQGQYFLLSHGNGPQVGSAIRRVELSSHEVYPLDLGICVADLQGGMGYMISQCLMNELKVRGINRSMATLITSVEVDPADPAFQNPTKPIGSVLNEQRAQQYERDFNWRIAPIKTGGFRRVVPSPRPKAILELDLIKQLVAQEQLLITAGGGGIPVIVHPNGHYEGVEAVIDKDLAASLLAREINAAGLFIVTGVAQVCIDFGTEQARPLSSMSLEEAQQYLSDGQFPPGSMGPKIQAAIEFLEGSSRPDARVVICDIDSMSDALEGRAGTTITRTGELDSSAA